MCDVREARVKLHRDDVLVCNIYAIVLGENNYRGGKIMISTIKPAPNQLLQNIDYISTLSIYQKRFGEYICKIVFLHGHLQIYFSQIILIYMYTCLLTGN